MNNPNSDEEKFYKSHPITYYNITDLEISEEIEKKFVPLKLEKTIIIKLKKDKSKDFER